MKRFCVICGGAFETLVSGVVCCKACYLEHEEPMAEAVGADETLMPEFRADSAEEVEA